MSNETTNPTRPMTAEEYWKECDYPQHSIMTEEQQRFIFAERYAAYLLRYYRQKKNSWMPTEQEMSSEQELLSYLESLRAKDPLFNEQVEFGRFLIRPIETLSEQELVRYNELKQILTPTGEK